MASRTQPRHGACSVSGHAALDRVGNRIWWVAESPPGVGQPQPGVVWSGKGDPMLQVQYGGGREQDLSWWPAWAVFPLCAGEVSSSGRVSLRAIKSPSCLLG